VPLSDGLDARPCKILDPPLQIATKDRKYPFADRSSAEGRSCQTVGGG